MVYACATHLSYVDPDPEVGGTIVVTLDDGIDTLDGTEHTYAAAITDEALDLHGSSLAGFRRAVEAGTVTVHITPLSEYDTELAASVHAWEVYLQSESVVPVLITAALDADLLNEGQRFVAGEQR